MKASRKRNVILWVALGILFVLGLGSILLRRDTVLNASKVVLGMLVIGAGCFRGRIRRWAGIREENEEKEDIRLLLKIMYVSLGVGLTFSGGTAFFNLPPTPVSLAQLGI